MKYKSIGDAIMIGLFLSAFGAIISNIVMESYFTITLSLIYFIVTAQFFLTGILFMWSMEYLDEILDHMESLKEVNIEDDKT